MKKGGGSKTVLEGGSWLTIHGVHIYVKSGKVIAGPAHFVGGSEVKASGNDTGLSGSSLTAHLKKEADKADLSTLFGQDKFSPEGRARLVGLHGDAAALYHRLANHLEQSEAHPAEVAAVRGTAERHSNRSAEYLAKDGIEPAKTGLKGASTKVETPSILPPPSVSGKSFTSTEEADEWGQKHYSSWADKLTAKESQAIDSYGANDFDAINHYLRTGKHLSSDKETSKYIEQMIPHLNKALSKGKAPEDFVAYRGVSGSLGKSIIAAAKSGGVVTDKGFMSMALAGEVAADIATKGLYGGDKPTHPVVLEIHVPRGSKGAYIGDIAGSSEWTPPAGSSLKLHAIKKGKGYTHVTATLVQGGRVTNADVEIIYGGITSEW